MASKFKHASENSAPVTFLFALTILACSFLLADCSRLKIHDYRHIQSYDTLTQFSRLKREATDDGSVETQEVTYRNQANILKSASSTAVVLTLAASGGGSYDIDQSYALSASTFRRFYSCLCNSSSEVCSIVYNSGNPPDLVMQTYPYTEPAQNSKAPISQQAVYSEIRFYCEEINYFTSISCTRSSEFCFDDNYYYSEDFCFMGSQCANGYVKIFWLRDRQVYISNTTQPTNSTFFQCSQACIPLEDRTHIPHPDVDNDGVDDFCEDLQSGGSTGFSTTSASGSTYGSGGGSSGTGGSGSGSGSGSGNNNQNKDDDRVDGSISPVVIAVIVACVIIVVIVVVMVLVWYRRSQQRARSVSRNKLSMAGTNGNFEDLPGGRRPGSNDSSGLKNKHRENSYINNLNGMPTSLNSQSSQNRTGRYNGIEREESVAYDYIDESQQYSALDEMASGYSHPYKKLDIVNPASEAVAPPPDTQTPPQDVLTPPPDTVAPPSQQENPGTSQGSPPQALAQTAQAPARSPQDPRLRPPMPLPQGAATVQPTGAQPYYSTATALPANDDKSAAYLELIDGSYLTPRT